jgi:cytochrome c oxidase assembly factor CtaG
MNEINMTPFIDVMLVLLIIFMVAAPLLAVGVPIDLPQTAAGAERRLSRRPLQRMRGRGSRSAAVGSQRPHLGDWRRGPV